MQKSIDEIFTSTEPRLPKSMNDESYDTML